MRVIVLVTKIIFLVNASLVFIIVDDKNAVVWFDVHM